MKTDKEYILCAAIRLADDNPRMVQTAYSDLAICEIGYRHCDIYERFGKAVSKKLRDQGFFTSKGRFVDRREAMIIAARAEQLKEGVQPFRPNPDIVEEEYPIINPLYSEDLY